MLLLLLSFYLCAFLISQNIQVMILTFNSKLITWATILLSCTSYRWFSRVGPTVALCLHQQEPSHSRQELKLILTTCKGRKITLEVQRWWITQKFIRFVNLAALPDFFQWEGGGPLTQGRSQIQVLYTHDQRFSKNNLKWDLSFWGIPYTRFCMILHLILPPIKQDLLEDMFDIVEAFEKWP